MQFVSYSKDGTIQQAGDAPYLDYRIPSSEELEYLNNHAELTGSLQISKNPR
ncbi:MAG: hypothetical protein R3C03_22040 [Pirellulaceae bacterium]